MAHTQGKAKYNKWAEFKDLKPEEAQKKYVEAVKKLVAKYK
jgi:acyl-CoA-binding protein